MVRHVAAGFALLLVAGSVAAQSGPQLLLVYPPGAKAGASIEVTVTCNNADAPEALLFSDPSLKAELVAGSAVAETKPRPPSTGSAISGSLTTAKFKVTAPQKSGISDVRVVSKNGLTNPRAFVVGSHADVVEKEPNSDSPVAQPIEMNTTVNGNLAGPTDVDYMKVAAKAGQNVVVYCLTTSIDSRMQAELQVFSPEGRPIAANRGYRDGDAVLDFLAPTDGDYLIRVSQFAYTTGGPDHFYRLTVTSGGWDDAVFPPLGPNPNGWEVVGRNLRTGKPDPRFVRPDGRPMMLEKIAQGKPPTFLASDLRRVVPPTSAMLDLGNLSADGAIDGNPILQSTNSIILDTGDNDTPDKAQAITLPCDVAGRVEKKNDRDWYAFDAKKGEVWTLEVFADRLGSPVDAFFILTDDKGKVITEQDDGPDTLSPNQFYTKSDDPGRYRFTVPADGKYRVVVSTRESAVQFGVRDQYVLRIAKENPDFRLAIMSTAAHVPEAGTLPRNGSVLFNVYVFRLDGYSDSITLTAEGLPKGTTCPPQTIGAGQTRGTLVLSSSSEADDWAGFITIKGTSAKLSHNARPFSVTWSVPGFQPNQPAQNIPMIARMDRGPGLALAVRGSAPFRLIAKADEPIKVKAGAKVELALKVERTAAFKEPIQVFSGTPGIGPRQQGNQPPTPVATVDANTDEAKLTLDVQQNLPPGTYTLVLTGRSGVPVPKGPNAKPVPSYPAAPVTVIVERK